MFDASPDLPDLRLLVGPGDAATLLGSCRHADARGRTVPCLIYVAVHRRGETWTHVYRAVADPRPGHLTVFMEKALPGAQPEAAAQWARRKFALQDDSRADAIQAERR
jgi:hypothetical protein